MSYILDALKKSDQERKRGNVPGLQTVHIPMAAEQDKPWLLYGVLVFLLLALVFVIGFMLSAKTGEQVNQLSDLPEVELDPGSDVDAHQINDAVMAESSGAIEPETPKEGLQEPTRTQIKDVLVVAATPKKTLQQAKPAVEMDLSEIPYLYELPDYQQQSIPDMQFAGHVYSSTASNRSVIINNNAMSEGDNIMQGLKVEQITSNGVVFRYQSLRFKMDILQDWSFE